MSLHYHQNGIEIKQPAYTQHVLNQLDINMNEDRNIQSPAYIYQQKDENEVPEEIPYLRKAIGLLQYLTITRMDIITELNMIAKRMHKPTRNDINAVKEIAKYISTTSDLGIKYNNGVDIQLNAYADASWASEDSYSRTGYCISLGHANGCIYAYSKVQSIIALSSQNSEIIALTEATRMIMHYRMLLGELNFQQLQPTRIGEDNEGAISFAQGRPNVDRTRHIEIKFRYCQEKTLDNEIKPVSIDTKLQLADMFTKSIGVQSNQQFTFLRDQVMGHASKEQYHDLNTSMLAIVKAKSLQTDIYALTPEQNQSILSTTNFTSHEQDIELKEIKKIGSLTQNAQNKGGENDSIGRTYSPSYVCT